MYSEQIEGILAGDFLPPVMMHVYPTNHCNSNCRWCIMREERKRTANLDRDDFERLIEDANKLGVKALHISGGGEPTLYKHLDVVRHFNGTTVLSTNGTMIGQTYTALNLWDLFDRIRVSVDAGSSEVYREVRGFDDFDHVMNNVEALSKARGNYDEEKQLGLGFVLDASNWEDVWNFCLLNKKRNLDLDFLHVRPAYYPRGSAADENVREIIRPAYMLTTAAGHASGVPIFSMSDKFRGYWTERSYKRCLATPLHAVVAATGEFIVCQDVFIRFGNLKTQRFEHIWWSEAHKKAISMIELDDCPRCVMNNANEVIENVFIENRIMKEIMLYWMQGAGGPANDDITGSDVPPAWNLEQNFPNPFNPVTTIRYSVSSKGPVSLKIYNAAGQLVRTLVNEVKNPGVYKIDWDGHNNRGSRVASGMYFYMMEAKDYRSTKKMVLLK